MCHPTPADSTESNSDFLPDPSLTQLRLPAIIPIVLPSAATASAGDSSLSKRRWQFVEQPESPLLRLPGELRNHICKYALSTTKSLKFVLGAPFQISEQFRQKCYFTTEDQSYDLEDEFNRLKYVCHQMYDETSCLELTLNTLCFTNDDTVHDGSWPLARECAEFLRHCTPPIIARISRVSIKLRADYQGWREDFYGAISYPMLLCENSASFETIAKFCRTYPQKSVCYSMKEFDFCSGATTVIDQGAILRLALRHENLIPLTIGDQVHATYRVAQVWASRRCVELLKVPNFRIVVKGVANYEDFKEELRNRFGFRENEIQKRLEMLQIWERDGI